MTEDTFRRGIDMLDAATSRFKMREETKAAYFKVLRDYSDEAWLAVCNKLLSTEDEMPKIPRLIKELGPLDKKHYADCGKCDMGRVHFQYESEHGILYDRFCACDDCDAGEQVAIKMSSLARTRARGRGLPVPMDDPDAYKYHRMRQRLGFRYVAEDKGGTVVGVWDKEGGVKTPKNEFLDAIASGKMPDLCEGGSFEKDDSENY